LALATLAAMLWTFSGLLHADQIPAYRDLLLFVVPIKYFLGEELRRGEIPLWNPYIHLGTPFLAGLQSAVFYPLSLLLVIPFPLGFNFFLLAHYAVALVGMWRLLRYRAMSVSATAVGSLVFVLGGYLVSMLNVTNHLQAAVWTPWLIVAWARYRDTGELRRWLTFIVLAAVQVLAGAPEVLLMTIAVLASWTAYSCFPRLGDTAKLEIWLVTALVFAAGLTAVQIFPTLEYLNESLRRGPLDYTQVTTWSLEPISLFQLLFPHSSSPQPPWEFTGLGYRFERIAPWIRSIYLGVAPLCLAIAGAACGRERRFWSAILLLGAALALGKHTPLFPVLYQWLPAIFAKFRYPEKFYFLVAFVAAILAAEGAHAVVGGNRLARRVALTAATTFLCIASSIIVVHWLSPMLLLRVVDTLRAEPDKVKQLVPLAADVVWKSHRLAWIAGIFVGLELLRKRGRLDPPTLAVLLVALVAVDLATIHRNLNLTMSWNELNARLPPVDVRELQQASERIFHYQTVGTAGEGIEARAIAGIDEWSGGATDDSNLREYYKDVWTALLADRVMMVHVEAIGGADGIERSSDSSLRAALSRLPREGALKILRTFSCRYLLGPQPLGLPDLQRVSGDELPSVHTYRIPDPLPAAYLVSRLRRLPTDAAILDTVGSTDFRPGIEAIVDELPPDWTQSEAVSPSGTATIVARDRRLTRVLVRTDRPALLVLNDSYFPGWEALVDGSRVKMYKANGMVRGVVVGSGDRIVEFRYRPVAWTIGLCTSAAFFAALLTLGCFALRRKNEMHSER
jgi:hypothetical protein